MIEKFSLDVEASKKLIKYWFESQGKVVKSIKINTLSNIDVELEKEEMSGIFITNSNQLNLLGDIFSKCLNGEEIKKELVEVKFIDKLNDMTMYPKFRNSLIQLKDNKLYIDKYYIDEFKVEEYDENYKHIYNSDFDIMEVEKLTLNQYLDLIRKDILFKRFDNDEFQIMKEEVILID